MAVRRWLGDTLMNAGLVSRQQLDEALAVQNTTGQKLGQTLVSLGYLTDAALYGLIARIQGLGPAAVHEGAGLAYAAAVVVCALLARDRRTGRRRASDAADVVGSDTCCVEALPVLGTHRPPM